MGSMSAHTGPGSYEERYAKMLALQVRFEAKTRVGGVPPGMPTPCHVWTGPLTRWGYGQLTLPRSAPQARVQPAHRVAYALRYGVWSTREVCLDHVCRNRACVSPDHLELVPQRENIRRGVKGALYTPRTHCPQGHALTPDNRYADRVRASGRVVQGDCRTCDRDRHRATWRAKNSKDMV